MPTVQETIQKAREFIALPAGWHFGEGVPPSQARISQAIHFLEFAEQYDISRANAFPGVRGQVEVTFYDANRMLEITIEADDTITIAEDRDREQIYFAENRSRVDAYRKLEEFSQDIWPSSDLFIGNTMTRNLRAQVSRVRPSTSEAGSLYPWLTVIARGTQAVHSVRIYHASTANKPESRRYTGQYETLISRPIARSYRRRLPAETVAIGTSTIGEEAPFAGFLRNLKLRVLLSA